MFSLYTVPVRSAVAAATPLPSEYAAERLIAVVIVASSRLVGAEHQRGLGLAEGSSFLEDRRDFGGGDEPRPTLLVHVEQPPDPVLLRGIAEHRRTLGALEGAPFCGLPTEQLHASVVGFDGGHC